MKDGIRFVVTDEERKAAYQLRFKVYVEGMDRLKDKGDLKSKELRDEYDNTAHTVVAIKKKSAVGTLRIFRGGDTFFDNYLTTAYHLSPFTKHLQANKICIVERLMIDENNRGSTLMLRMYKEVMKFVLRNKIELVLLNCVPEQQQAYMKLGFQPFTDTYDYPGIGQVIPMALITGDYEHLKNVGSPFAILADKEELNYCKLVGILQEILKKNREDKIGSQTKPENKEFLKKLFSAGNHLINRKSKAFNSSRLRFKLDTHYGNEGILTS